MKAEALLKLHRHQDADKTLLGGPIFNFDDLNKYFGPIGNANLLVVRAQVDMAAGRLVFLSSILFQEEFCLNKFKKKIIP